MPDLLRKSATASRGGAVGRWPFDGLAPTAEVVAAEPTGPQSEPFRSHLALAAQRSVSDSIRGSYEPRSIDETLAARTRHA